MNGFDFLNRQSPPGGQFGSPSRAISTRKSRNLVFETTLIVWLGPLWVSLSLFILPCIDFWWKKTFLSRWDAHTTAQQHQNDGPRVCRPVSQYAVFIVLKSAPPEVLEFSTRLLRLRAYLRRLKNIVLLKNLIHGQFRDQQIGNRQHTDCLKIRYLDLYVDLTLVWPVIGPSDWLWRFAKWNPSIKSISECTDQP